MLKKKNPKTNPTTDDLIIGKLSKTHIVCLGMVWSLAHVTNNMRGILITFSSFSWRLDLDRKEGHLTVLLSKILLRVSGHLVAFSKPVHRLPLPVGVE